VLDRWPERIAEIKALRAAGTTVPEIMRRVRLSKATLYRALYRALGTSLSAINIPIRGIGKQEHVTCSRPPNWKRWTMRRMLLA
jgi:Helix-turn-helix domain of resolvase